MSLESIAHEIRKEIEKLTRRSSSARTRIEKDDTGTAEDVSSRQEKNRSRTTGTVGENQGREEKVAAVR